MMTEVEETTHNAWAGRKRRHVDTALVVLDQPLATAGESRARGLLLGGPHDVTDAVRPHPTSLSLNARRISR